MSRRAKGHGLVRVEAVSDALLGALGYRVPEDVLDDPRGVEVRRLPRGSTWRFEVGGEGFYRKIRMRRTADARNEWASLRRLRDGGLPVPEPLLFVEAAAGRTALVMREVPGRGLRDLLQASMEDGLPDRQLVERVASIVRRMHALGCFHRDLYLGHLLATSLEPDAQLHLIDVERAVWPRWRRRRWLVKDLAALWSSWPFEPSLRLALRFLRDAGVPTNPRLLQAVQRKADQIRAHRPRHDGVPPPPSSGGDDRG